MLKSKTRWMYPTYDEDAVAKLQEELNVSSLVAKLFQARQWTDVDEATLFLKTEEQSFHDPFLLEGMREAVHRIEQALQSGEKIRIYGDYDCDGVSSTALLVHVLRERSANFDYYIPNRFSEGYGLNKAALAQAKDEGVHLLITVDTGISAKEQVEYANQLGLDVIITDHHQPPPELPSCVAVINPQKATCTYPYPYLAGVGVAFKLAQALLGRVPYELLDLVTIGTIADLVPLTGENRLIVFHGLKALNKTKHVGLQALLEVAGLDDQQLDEQHVGFSLGPRLNASGRLERADTAVQLLTASIREEALSLAARVDQLNRERQALVETTTKEAIDWVQETYGGRCPRFLVVAGEAWNVGVIGIVASRLVERYYVPTIVLSIDSEGKIAKGSARSIAGFDMYQALVTCQEKLNQFGGHPQAAGLALHVEQIDPLRRQLIQLAEQRLRAEDFVPLTSIDVVCTLEEVSLSTIQDLARLAPFGIGNPRPTFLLEQYPLAEGRQVGADQKHLKCKIGSNEAQLDGIGFGWGEVLSKISPGAKIDILGQLDINEWNGVKKPQIVIHDLRIEHYQVFDWRGVQDLQKKWSELNDQQQLGICIHRRETPLPDSLPDFVQTILVDQQGNMLTSNFPVAEIDSFILYDLPQSLEQFQGLMQTIAHAQRYYLHFQSEEEHYFSSLPSKDQFKWYYAFLQKQAGFELDKHAWRLAEHKGWSLDTIQFMTEVFQELQFIKLEHGRIYLVEQPVKRELASARIYQEKQKAMELEQLLKFSSYKEVAQLIEDLLTVEIKKEAIVHGF